MFKSSSKRLGLLAVGASVAFAIGSQAPAHASTSIYLATSPNASGGWGFFDGDLTWATARRGVLAGSVTDRCPADGKGTYLQTRAFLAGGTYATSTILYDNDGCSNGSEPATQHGIYNPNNAIIDSVLVKLCVNDGFPSNWTDCDSSDLSPRYYNPYN